ncbi:MAG TPA: PDZ domain-containing protein [Gemmataceae bacterium]|nr:PDZ domain-containing protein [Gemmataceae bacterium]
MKTLKSSYVRLVGLLLLASAGLYLTDASGQPGKGQPKGPPVSTKFEGMLPDNVVKSFQWRSVGPANMSGRITAIAVVADDPSCYWVATASGGLVKTTNNGMTFEHQFDRENTVSIGDVAVAPSNRDIVWVGTGEGNPRNSVSYGDGVYKSVDGGRTWKNMGLKETYQIGKILIHPSNPDIVYVGALGRCYGDNPERGVFKTTDGGKSWTKILYKDAKTGVIDMSMHPTDPNTLLVAMYERVRDGFDAHLAKEWPEPYDWYDPIVRFGVHAGIYKTTDGGKSFTKTTQGLPPSKLGRIGLDWCLANPNVVYAIVDCEDIGKGPAQEKKGGRPFFGFSGEDAQNGYRVTTLPNNSPVAKSGVQAGDVITALNGKAVKSELDFRMITADMAVGDKLTITVKRGADKKDFDMPLVEGGGGKGFGGGGGGGGKGGSKDRPNLGQLGGQNENLDQGADGWKYGGVYRSDDAGQSWKRVNSLQPRPMYFSVVKVDPQNDKLVYVLGVSQYRSYNGGKTFTADAGNGVHADAHAMWINPKNGKHMLIGCDGGWYVSYDRADSWDHLNNMALGQFYHVAMCNKKPYWLYGGLQDNGSWGVPSVGLKGRGPLNEDVVSIGGGDGFVCRVDPNDPDLVYSESQGGAISRRNLRTGEKAQIRPAPPGGGGGGKGMGGGGGAGGGGYRWNWNTPMLLSHFNSKIFYTAGNYVFKSLDRGDDLKIISPDITLTKLGSASALSESPKNQDVLWVGSDDGALWVTRNGGKDWKEVSANVGLPGPRWVATIEASRFKEGRCYVCFDAHRSNDDQPYIFVTEDYGASWAPLRGNLPGFGSTRCLREDIENEDLLFCGTEFHLYASINRGASWAKINNNLPTVAIHEVAIHPTAGEIAVAKHGRSLWIMDVTALRQMKPDVLAKNAQLFKPNTAIRWQTLATTGGTNRKFVGTNPPPGAGIYYYLGKDAKDVTVKILDVSGATVGTMSSADNAASVKQGLNVVRWNMAIAGKDGGMAGGKKGGGGGGFGGKGGPGGFGGFGGGPAAPPGVYRVVLSVDGQEFTSTVRIEADPNVGARSAGGSED